MSPANRRRIPLIIEAINVLDWHNFQLCRRDPIQASHADPIESADAWRQPDPVRPHPALPAKQMLLGFRMKPVVGQRVLPRQQPERRWRHQGSPATDLQAIRTVTTQSALRQVDVGFEADGAAMAAALIGFFHGK